jgi:tetratricopeptide (TPR) repeat protein
MLMGEKRIKLNLSKRLFYNSIIIFFPFIILFFAEVLLRIINYGDNLALFVNYPYKEFNEYKIVNPEIGKKYFQRLEYTRPGNDMFLKQKPDNGLRIFVLGSSTAIGFPYSGNLTFSRILHKRLQDNYPGKHIEVINTAITAINSFTLLDFINEILKESPDAILIYAGHNEFYGAFGIGSNEKIYKYRSLTFLHLDLLSLRLYQLLRNTIAGTNRLFSAKKTGQNARGTLMKRIAENKEILYKGEIYNTGIKQFRGNMDKLLKKAKRKGVPVFISEVICNIRDLKPFCSMITSEYPAAIEIYNKGIKYEEEENYKLAKKNYYLAKELDCIRFRASEEINEIIHELSAKYKSALVTMKTYFEKKSPNGLIGNNLVIEHVHPNISGYFLMADAFFNEIAKSKLIAENINILYYKSSEYYKRNWGYTELDSLFGVHRINNLSYHWPFQPLNAPYVDYRKIYKPVSLIDSLAFTAMKSPDLNIADAHLELAEFYKGKSDFYNAFREYQAAITCNPFWAEDYLEAAICLININDFPLALNILNKSLELKETFYGYYLKGEILLLKGGYAEAVESLNKASQFVNINDEEKLLEKQLEAYFFNGDSVKSRELLIKLRRINPAYEPQFSDQKLQYNFIVPIQVENIVHRALKHFKEGNLDSALEEFLYSLEIKETPLANRMVGEILIRKNNNDATIYFLKAYPDFKDDVSFLYNLGILLIKNRRIQKAQGILNEIKHLDPGYEKIPVLEKLIQVQNIHN